MLIDGDKLMMSLADWWYSSFGEEETEDAKAIRKVMDSVEESLKYYTVTDSCSTCLRQGCQYRDGTVRINCPLWKESAV